MAALLLSTGVLKHFKADELMLFRSGNRHFHPGGRQIGRTDKILGDPEAIRGRLAGPAPAQRSLAHRSPRPM
jgi:hypothetical protein